MITIFDKYWDTVQCSSINESLKYIHILLLFYPVVIVKVGLSVIGL